MLKNKFIVKKIRNICILVMALIIMLGAYSNIRNSRAEKVESIRANIIDSNGFLADELIDLEITNEKDKVYEIELPEAINSKIIEEFVNITLVNIANANTNAEEEQENNINSTTVEEEQEQKNNEAKELNNTDEQNNINELNNTNVPNNENEQNTAESQDGTEMQEGQNQNIAENLDEAETQKEQNSTEQIITEEPSEKNVEIVDGNKIYIEKEDLKNKEIRINVKYDAQFLDIADDGAMSKRKVASISEEEKTQKNITSAQILYKRKLKYEDEENGKLVEVNGYMPNTIKLKVEEVQKESLTEILENAEIDIAYDIKLIQEYCKFVPVDENIKLEDIPIENLKFVTETIENVNSEQIAGTVQQQNEESIFNTEAVLNENITENGLATPVKITTNANGEEQNETGKRQIWEYNIIDENTGEVKETKQIEFKEIVELEEIDPKTYDENCEVTIKDTNIREKVNVYHITENNTYERITPKENEKETVTFDANTFSIYVIGTDATSKNIENVQVVGASSSGSNITFSGSSTGTWHSSVTVTASSSNSDVLIKGIGFSTTAGTSPGVNGNTSATKSSTGTWYCNVVYGYKSEQEDASQGTYVEYAGPYKVDATAPSTPSISKSPNTSSWTTSSVTVSASGGSDSHSGFSHYQHKTDSGSWSSGSSVTLSSSDNYTVYFRSVDNVGNVSDSKSTTVKIDKTKPTISFAKESSSSTWARSYSIKVTIADAHSGLASGGSVKYGWSTSNSTAPENWTTVELSNSAGASSTSFTAKCSGYDTGKYYLWVKPITLKDEVGNEKTGTEITSGKFWVDRTKPKNVTISPTSEATWAKEHTVTLTMEDAHSGLASGNTLNFQWSKDGTNQPDSFDGTRSPSYTDGTGTATATINKTKGSGKFYLWVQPETYEDVAGNSNTTVVKAGEFWFDNTVPDVGCPSGDTSYKKVRNEPITIYDEHSGLKTGATVQYGWSTSNTTEPTSWTTEKPTYTAGTNTVSFYAHGEGMNGQYYLWVKTTGVSDMVGNTNNTTLVSTTTFGFDCVAPTISANPTTNTTWVKTQTVTINMADSLSGLSASTQIRYGWSTSDTTAPSYSTMNPGFTEGAKTGSFTITASELSGIYYLWIDASSATDVAGNTISSTQKYGPFYLDNIPPEIIYSLEKYETWKQSHDVLVTISDQQSGIASGCSVKWGWSTSATIEPEEGYWYTQSISVSAGTKEYSFHATLSNVTGKYYLWVKPITLKDVVGNVNTETKISTGTFWTDNTKPTISVKSSEETTGGVTRDGLRAEYNATGYTGNYHNSSAIEWEDLTGNLEYPATIHGGSWENEEYLSLDGTDDWVNLKPMTISTAATLDITITPKSIQANEAVVIANYESGGMGISLDNGKPYFNLYLNGTYVAARSEQLLTVGQKYHIVGTYDGSSIKIYINGVLKATTAASGTIGQPASGTSMVIGANPEPNNGDALIGFANINVYNAKIYDRALTASEVTTNYNGGKTTTNLIREFDGYNNTGNRLVWKDLAGADDNGVIYNGAEFVNGEYLSLNGVDQRVNLTEMNFEKVTLEATITPKSIQSGEVNIVANLESGGYGLALTDGYANMAVYISDVGYKYATATEPLQVGQKYHIVGTYDGTTIKLYINGELKASTAITGTIKTTYGTTIMAIGANPSGRSYPQSNVYGYANINVYNVRIYSRDITEEEVNKNLTAGENQSGVWAKEHYVDVTLEDAHSGLANGNNIKYSWGYNTVSTPNSNVKTAPLSYTAGTNSYTFTASGGGITGKYYLWIMPSTYKDVAGNSNISNVISTEQYWFDNKGPIWTISNLNKDQANKFVTLDLLGTDEHSGYARNSLTPDDITVWVDGVEVNSITKVLSRGNETGTGVQYRLSLANFEEALRQEGKLYKEWSGNVAIKIKERTLVDVLGNESEASTLSLGHIDFINPEFTYKYSETDIDQTNKTVKIEFTVTDKYFYENKLTQATIDDLTILIDGEEPIWKGSRTDMPNYGVTRTLTSEQLTETRDGGTAVIGYKFTLVLSDLEQSKVLSGDNYLNYSGTISVAIPAGEFSDTTGNTNRAQVISLGLDIFETDTTTSNVYVPAGYSYVEGNLETGYVIEDSSGNQYVWVEVPKTSTVYPNAGTDITKFTDAEFELIESDLKSYTSAYRGSNKYSDEYAGTSAISGLTENEYNTQKKKMLKSVYKNGGFYIGRYETGIDYSEGQRTANGDTTQKPVIKKNAYVYDFVTTAQAQNLASSMAFGEYTSSLLFGVQWDLTLKYLETKGTSQAELKTDSSSWGNYYVSSYNITNTNSKYATSWMGGFTDGAYGEKSAKTRVYLTTGASETFQKQNIYDLAGNALDKTLEFYVKDDQVYSVNRGWSWGYWLNGDVETSYPYASTRNERADGQGEFSEGFRVALYKDEGTGADSTTTEPTYIPQGYSHVEGTNMETGYVVADSSGNEYVWVEVPQTEEVYQTAGLGITSFTTADYELIEHDLQSYTSVYRGDATGGNPSTTFLDEWCSETLSTMSESDYYSQKKKMLKSVYKNGGFYIGRYETGIDYSEGYRTVAGNTTQTPVIKKNAYLYNAITNTQAQNLANSFASSGYTSSLLFGVQYDLIMKYLETKGSTYDELAVDSTSWGNYWESSYNITNENAKYSVDAGGTYQTGSYSKEAGNAVILSTGASENFKKQNIYDLAGSGWCFTLDANKSADWSCIRGGNFAYFGHGTGANLRWAVRNASSHLNVGFRVALYKDEGTGTDATEPTYIPEGYSHVSGTNMDNGYVVSDSSGNEYVWVEVPKSASVYTTAGTNITDFTEAEFALIEQDLQSYTSDYKLEDNYVDEHSGNDESTGLTENEYYTLKKKMLKSIYKNEGFYVGRYETGVDYSQGARHSTEKGNISKTPVIKKDAYPYNWVTSSEAQTLAETFTTSGYQSSLLFGVQWDLMLKYIEASGGATKDELLTDSTYLGNYKNNLWTITNTNSRYSTNGSWSSSSYGTKTSAAQIYLTTGASDSFSRKNIYDFTGNVREWTLEFNNTAESSITAARSAYAGSEGTGWPAAWRSSNTTTFSDIHWGFRVALYKDEGTGVADSEPTYIPEGYSHVSGTDMDSGYVISDSKGNEYVWVEVPRTATVYKTAGLGIVQYTDAEYEKIEADLKEYTSSYGRSTVQQDEYPGSSLLTGMTENEYYAQKRKMLKSIYKNGGFYVGRYETGINYSEGYRNETVDATQKPVIKKNAYVYDCVTVSQAQTLSESFAGTGYSSSLMFGVQWDLILKYFETKGTSHDEIVSNSTSWGNYYNSSYNITNTSAKYKVYQSGTWSWGDGAYGTKPANTSVYLTTGASDTFKKQNIYDIAGNAFEWTLERWNNNTTTYLINRGWNFTTYTNSSGVEVSNSFASHRNTNTNTGYAGAGFRVALYKDENDTEPEYTPNDFTKVEGTDTDTGYVVKDTSGNEYVWVEVPKTSEVYKTAGLNVSQFTDAEYSRIEKDLQNYTSAYRNGTTYVDEYSGNQNSTGLNKDEYYTLKKKMLKSIYKNGGFYIGRYETGIEYSQGARTSAGESTTQTPVIKQNAYPYNYVTVAQSQDLAETFSTYGYVASLPFGVQWDLVLKYLETTGSTQAELNTNSTDWGNYKNNLYNITNTNSKYSPSGNTWTSGAYGQKSSSADILLTTGASDTFQKKNIYDLAGNAYEGTLEYNPNGSSTDTVVYRGGSSSFEGTETTASNRVYNSDLSYAKKGVGFRVALFKDEGLGVDDGLIADVVDPFWRAENIEKNVSTQTVELDLIGTDKYFKESTLTANDLSITVDGVNITELGYANIEFGEEEQLREDRDGDGVAEVQYGVKHHLKITNWEEPTTRDGNPYKEWSGVTNIVVEADTLSDKYGNISKQQNVSLGQVDLIRPIMKYTYSEADINYTTKTLTINFSIADKYIQRDMGLNANQLTVLVDGEEPAWKKVDGTVMGTSGACKTLTKTSVTVKNTATGALSTKDVNYTLQTNERVVAVNYKLLLENLEQDPNDGFHYSGPVTVSFPANVAVDSYGNYNNATTITVGIDETGFDGEGGTGTGGVRPSEVFDPSSRGNAVTGKSASSLYDAYGINENGLHIGDFINYDAGTWTSSEINSIQTGFKTDLQTANGTSDSPTGNFQFGGFSSGDTKNGSIVTESDVVYDKSDNSNVTGWRVFDINGDKITLISAGTPEQLYIPTLPSAYGYVQEYVVTGNVNSSWTDGETEKANYKTRNWDSYVNTTQNAESAAPLTKSMLDSWYSKYTNTSSADSSTTATFRKIYDTYTKYLNLIDTGTKYWLTDYRRYQQIGWYTGSTSSSDRSISARGNTALGIRVTVTLSADTLLSSSRVGTKTLTGGNMDDYGGDQTYNVWDIVTEDSSSGSTSNYDSEKLHIGDFVNYDAGTWTSSEISSIQTGLKTNLQTATGSPGITDNGYQFTGFIAGSSRNENATAAFQNFNYLNDETTGLKMNGWRVFDVNGDEITLISAGNPEDFCVADIDDAYEYVLSGNVNSNWTNGSTEKENYQKRDWSMYINSKQYATSATPLTADALKEWYKKYTGIEISNIYDNNAFDSIYTSDSNFEYQNIIDNNSFYWFASNDDGTVYFDPQQRAIDVNAGFCLGIRMTVTLSADTLLSSSRVGTKTISGSNMDGGGDLQTYSEQTYNVWDIVTNSSSSGGSGGSGSSSGSGSVSDITPGPYLPSGYSVVEGIGFDDQIVIQDSLGNEYVWIIVDKTTVTYPTAGINITEFTDSDYEKIENDLNAYVADYDDDSESWIKDTTDTWNSESCGAQLTQEEYTALKKQILKSIYLHGGFYIGRYEVGIDYSQNFRVGESEPLTQTPVIKQDAYPYTYVNASQAQNLAESFSSVGYQSSLMLGIQWELILKHLENYADLSEDDIINDSSSWGNFADTEFYTTSANPRCTYDGATWEEYNYKPTGEMKLFSTGASDKFQKAFIYDLAGNVAEWTLEYYDYSGCDNIAHVRGSNFEFGNGFARHGMMIDNQGYGDVGFRTTLIKTDFEGSSGSDSSSGSDVNPDAKIVDVVDPVWIVEGQSASTDASGKTSANVSLIAVDKYFDSVTATTAELENQIQVLIDGNDISSIAPELEKTLTYVELVKLDEATGTYVTASNSDEAQGARYTFSLSNLEESTSTYWSELQKYEANSSTGRPYREFSGPLQVKVPAGTVKDKSGNTSKELVVDLGNIDAIKPEIIYRYSSSDIDHDNKKAQIVFSVTDKYLKETTEISASDFTIKIDGEEPVWRPESGETGVTRTLTKTAKMVMNKTTGVVSTQSGTYTLTSNERLVGETYTITLEHLEQLDDQGYGDGETYSGVVTVVMPNTKFKDETNSSPSAMTLTVGINQPEGTGSSQIVDVVDPVWKKGTSTVNTNASGITTAVVELIAEDKYFSRIVPSTTDALKNMLKVYVAGDDKTSELDITLSGPTSTAKGKKYTFTLTNFEESYSEFLAQRALYANNPSTGRLYREFSGSVQLEIPAGTVEDTSGNVNKLTTMDLGTIDTLKPEVVKVSSSVDSANKTETIVFDITDKFMASSAITTTDTSKIHIMVDDTEITDVTKQITNIQELRASVGTNTNQLVGYRYTLKISNFEKATRNADKYVDYSGTVAIKIDANTGVDTSGTGNAETILTGDFVDFIKPNITYKYLTSDINKAGKSFQMAFEVTDKYYTGTKLTINDLFIQIADGKNTYNLKETPVEITLNSDEAITVSSMKKTNATSGVVETVSNAVIGHKYVLTISGLEQLEIASGNTTLDYSGIVTVAISANKVSDTSNNKNVATTITSGVDLPDGSGTGTVVDVVKPIWRKTFGGDINWDTGTASVVIKGTDTYYASNSLTASNIKVYSYNGAVKTDITSSVTVTLSTATALNESVTVNGTTSSRQYGVQYTINLAGLPIDKDQIKIAIPAGTLTDTSGNTNDLYETRLYATLMSTASETLPTSAFLGNTALQRQNIESVTFVTSLEGALSNKWDVSSAQDESIWAWYTTSGGVYQVTIGSDEFVCANRDSSYLFAHIGYSESCTTANVLNGLDKFNTLMTTNMSHMFYNTGKEKLITLDLGTAFNTENVTNMNGMFEGCGYKAMTSANFGNGFTTANVTDMGSMFKNFGHEQLVSFNLNTIAGDFRTENVTNMASMFEGLGHKAMTTMIIGNNFNTSKVTNMNAMFRNCGYTTLQSLDCGDLFVTTAVTDMDYMFNGCGATAMTVLDLGPAFTNIPSEKSTDFMTSCGTSSLVVYAPEAIYSNRVNFKTK